MKTSTTQTFELRSCIKKELYTQLKISRYHLNKIIKDNKEQIGNISGTLLTIEQVKIIIAKIGIPRTILIE